VDARVPLVSLPPFRGYWEEGAFMVSKCHGRKPVVIYYHTVMVLTAKERVLFAGCATKINGTDYLMCS